MVVPTISLGAIDQFTAPRGNSWQATSMYSSGILNDILNRDAGQDWRNWMNSFALQNTTNPTNWYWHEHDSILRVKL